MGPSTAGDDGQLPGGAITAQWAKPIDRRSVAKSILEIDALAWSSETPVSWGRGYATEGAKECLRVGFDQLGLDEIVSFAALTNQPSVAVMRRIGMTDAHANFEHPAVPEGNPLRPHCLYKITRAQWMRREA